MIKQEVTLTDYNWNVKVLFGVTCKDLEEITKELYCIGCPKDLIDEATDNFDNCIYNHGLTYSNYLSRQTLIIIGKASSMSLAFNTVVHEAYHFISLLSHINNIVKEEERATLIGNFVMQLDQVLRDILKRN